MQKIKPGEPRPPGLILAYTKSGLFRHNRSLGSTLSESGTGSLFAGGISGITAASTVSSSAAIEVALDSAAVSVYAASFIPDSRQLPKPFDIGSKTVKLFDFKSLYTIAAPLAPAFAAS